MAVAVVVGCCIAAVVVDNLGFAVGLAVADHHFVDHHRQAFSFR